MRELATYILDWYDVHARRFAWRTGPGQNNAPDPYRIWLSEVMLQQTQSARAERYFLRFVSLWPGVADLAAAPLPEVMKEWAGLGYYSRARNLHACARKLALNGFPRTPEALQRLPGIGPYTAAAIAAIAFKHPVAALDTNVSRVIARIHNDPGTDGKSAWQRRIGEHAARALDPRRPGDWAQALMDIGAEICTASTPKCPECPLASCCRARAMGTARAIPARIDKPPRPRRHGSAYYLIDGDQAMLVRRPDHGLLGGMLAVPTGPWRLAEDAKPADDQLPEAVTAGVSWRSVGEIRHSFTHFSLRLEVWRGAVAKARPEGIWTARACIANAGLASVFRKAALLAEAAEGD